MLTQEGKRFRRSFCGYNRAAVDAEFGRLIEQNENLGEERHTLKTQVDSLNEERNKLSREQIKLSSDISTMTGQVMELESNLAHAKADYETMEREIEAHKAEKNALAFRVDHLKERDRDFALREREFAELQSSVSSIMSVTKRASDRLFQKVVENQEKVTQIAGDAAREVAAIRADMAQVREQLNAALDEVQDRIDRVDASLTGAVHKLVAIKHDDGLRVGENQPDILTEVERLLSMRAGDVDDSDGKNYSVPVLGPYSAKLLSDTAHRVSEGKISAKLNQGELGVKRVSPTQFESSEDSRGEANRLLERGGATAEEFYAANPQFVSGEPVTEQPGENDGAAIPLGPISAPQPQPMQIGFVPYNEPMRTNAMSGNVYYGDSFAQSAPVGYESYPVRTYSYQPQTYQPAQKTPKQAVQQGIKQPARAKNVVTVRTVKASAAQKHNKAAACTPSRKRVK